ncbi:MAG: hypothetical protein J6C20_01920 [Paludibacteraceae bacterium]|nr:hypothetical protein [Paludibacteraceae bacterium]
MKDMRGNSYIVVILTLFLTCVQGVFSQSEKDKDGYIPKGEYNTCETRDLMPTYSEVLYSADAEVINSTWQNDGFSYSNGAFTTGNYNENQQFFASSPSFSLPIQRLGTHIYLRLDSEIDSESWYDVAYIKVVNLRTGESFTVYANHGIRARAIEYIDLGYFHGNEIRLDFSFSSDSSFHGKGWSIYEAAIVGDKLLSTSTPKLKSRIKAMNSSSEDNKMQEPEGGVSENGGIDVSSIYKGIKIQLISVNFKNGNEGTIGFTMTDAATNEYYQPSTIDSSHFKVKVGGKEVSICGQVQENQHNNVDVVYAVDCSGTMKSMQQTLSDNIRDLTKKFEEKFSAKYGAFLFGGTDTDCNYDVRPLTLANNFYLTPNADGLTERYYDVLDSITKHPFLWVNAQKIIVMIGDEDASGSNGTDCNGNQLTQEFIAQNLRTKSFQTYIVNKGNYMSDFSEICKKTYGLFVKATNDLSINNQLTFDRNTIINHLTQSLNARYYIDFCLSDNSFNCLDTTNVSLEFNYKNGAADSTLSLVEFAPSINRIKETISLSDTGWRSCNDSLPITFAVSNKCGNDIVQSAVVYYAFNNDSVFAAKAVNLTSNDTLSANIFIPDSVSKIDYRISVQMKNSRFIATSPQVTNTMGDTWIIPVCCDSSCEEQPRVTSVNWNCDSTIVATTGNTNDGIKVYFMYNNGYRENLEPAQYTYVPVEMTRHSDSVYMCKLPDDIIENHIAYFIYMTDTIKGMKYWYGYDESSVENMEINWSDSCNGLCGSFSLTSNPITSYSDTISFNLIEGGEIKFLLTDEYGNKVCEIKKDLNKGRVQLSLRKDVFYDLDYKTIDPLKPYILTISTGKEVLMTYIYFSRL